MLSREPGKKIKNLCHLLGNEYSIKVIDLENVICRDFGNGFRIVISDVDNNSEECCVTINVWNVTKDMISDSFYNVYPAEKIKKTIELCVVKYSNLVQDINGNVVI